MNMILFDSLHEHSPGTFLILRGDHRAEHIIKVLRLHPGDSFSMGMVNGPSGAAEIQSIEDGTVRFTWRPEHPCIEPHRAVLLVGAVRPICMKRILREAVSLGVSEIWVTGTDLGEKSYLGATIWKDERYRSFLLDGAQQAAASYIPDVKLFPRVDEAVRECGGSRLFLDIGEGSERIPDIEMSSLPVVLAVGSERGWSSRERSLFLRSGWKSARLGSRILRTETACSAGIAVLLSSMGLV